MTDPRIDTKSSQKAAVLACAVVFALIINLPVDLAASPQEVAARSLPSVVAVVVTDVDKNPTGFGSGFFVEREVLLTCFHVINGAAAGYVKPIGEDATRLPIAGILAVDEASDIALLRVTKSSSIPTLPLGESDELCVADRVFALGNPVGLEGTFSEGVVSSLRRGDGFDLVQITAPISHGSSGGPVLNESGLVIGVSTAFVEGGQNLNFAVPSRLIRQLLSVRRILTLLKAKPKDTKNFFHWKNLRGGSRYENVKRVILSQDYHILDFDKHSITARVGTDPDVVVNFRFKSGMFYQYEMLYAARDSIWILNDLSNLAGNFGQPISMASISGHKIQGFLIGEGFLACWQNESDHVLYSVSGFDPLANDSGKGSEPTVRKVCTDLRFGPPPVLTERSSNKSVQSTK